MNWWFVAGGSAAAYCALGHEVFGRKLYYRPIRSGLDNATLVGVFAGIWYLITINFGLSALALFIVALAPDGIGLNLAGQTVLASFVAAQFAGYAAVLLVLSLRLGGALKLFAWIPFAVTAILAGLGATVAH